MATRKMAIKPRKAEMQLSSHHSTTYKCNDNEPLTFKYRSVFENLTSLGSKHSSYTFNPVNLTCHLSSLIWGLHPRNWNNSNTCYLEEWIYFPTHFSYSTLGRLGSSMEQAWASWINQPGFKS